ncbi:MAG: DUF3891 family protein [Acetobacteraceae bacterium]
MLWRSLDCLAIAQPAHAWLAGQLVRAWGNSGFPAPDPAEPVSLAAEQHDLGWHAWERMPTLNPATGRPHMFRELPVGTHTGLWREGVATAMAFGRYPALLVSLHGTGLYAAFDAAHAPPGDAAVVRAFLASQTALQDRLVAQLAADPAWRDAVAPERLAASRALIALTDRLSLAICGGVTAPVTVQAAGLPAIALMPLESAPGDPCRLRMDPWPFRLRSVRVVCEGRPLPGRFQDEGTMRQALCDASAVTVVTDLVPA